jgi:hypothetical protein
MAREVVEVVPESAAEGFTVLTNRWVLRIKRNADHTVDRYRARVTARGFEQIPGKDFDQTYASVAKLKTFRILLALSTALSLRVTQLDVKTAFLYAPLEETLFMKWPEGIAGEPGTLLKLKKNLYGLKQAPKAWWNEIVGVFLDLDFVPCVTDPCLLVHKTARFFVLLYVDDILLATADEKLRKTVEDALSAKFQLTGFHLVERYLNLQVEQHDGVTILHQHSYVESVVAKFNMHRSQPAPTPGPCEQLSKDHSPSTDAERESMRTIPYRSAVGALLYAAGGTMPDIMFAVNSCCQYAQNPGVTHWRAVKRILRYLNNTKLRAIEYRRQENSESLQIDVFSDSDWAADRDNRRSKTGYVVMIAGGPVIWQTRSQKSVALSSCEAELYALCEATKEIKWLTQLLGEMRIPFSTPNLHVDNQGAIALSSNPVQHQRTKHIDIRWFFIREALEAKVLKVVYVSTSENLADLFTKAVTVAVHEKLTGYLMVTLE